jgi:serine protease Do
MIAAVRLALMVLAAPAEPSSFDRDRAAAIRSAVALAAPSIVVIETIGGAQPIGEPTLGTATAPGRRRGDSTFRVAEGPTSGLVWSADGLIVTSSFNFVRNPSIITVVLSDGRRFVARLLARDTIRRLALLKIDAAGLPVPVWAPAGEIRVGQYAIACGRGFGGPTPSISVGIVSAVARRSGNALQTDAKLSPANYGGPLIDIDGRVLGICVPLAGGGGELAGVEWYDSGIGFAVPRPRIEAVAPRLADGRDIEAGKIGVLLAPVATLDVSDDEQDESGAALRIGIRAVAEPSPAARAGLRAGDIIVALNGAVVGDLAELQRRLSDIEAGAEIALTIEREAAPLTVRVTLDRLDAIGAFPSAEGRPPATRPSG